MDVLSAAGLFGTARIVVGVVEVVVGDAVVYVFVAAAVVVAVVVLNV